MKKLSFKITCLLLVLLLGIGLFCACDKEDKTESEIPKWSGYNEFKEIDEETKHAILTAYLGDKYTGQEDLFSRVFADVYAITDEYMVLLQMPLWWDMSDGYIVYADGKCCELFSDSIIELLNKEQVLEAQEAVFDKAPMCRESHDYFFGSRKESSIAYVEDQFKNKYYYTEENWLLMLEIIDEAKKPIEAAQIGNDIVCALNIFDEQIASVKQITKS